VLSSAKSIVLGQTILRTYGNPPAKNDLRVRPAFQGHSNQHGSTGYYL